MSMTRFAGLLAVAALICFVSSARASVVFDDFDTNAGHFGYTPTFSTTSNVSSASTNTRQSTDGADSLGAGYTKVTAIISTSTPARIRMVSGGPPYNSANGGIPVGNVSFTVSSASVDGFIGFYFRTITSGLTLAINLDGPVDGAASMTGSVPKTVTAALADGAWHLFEWDLDTVAQWGAVAGIGGANTNLNGAGASQAHTIDSLYIQSIPGTSGQSKVIDIDFVAKSDSGSIAALAPEPASLGLLALAAIGVIRRRR
jgi:hypothetical protein